MIDKVFPRKLNSSTDARVRGKDEMIDAVNVTIDDNSDDFGKQINAPSGNFGVLKPVKGNLASPNNDDVDFSGNGRVIGSCVDERDRKSTTLSIALRQASKASTSTPNRITRFLQYLPLSTLTFPLSPLWSLT